MSNVPNRHLSFKIFLNLIPYLFPKNNRWLKLATGLSILGIVLGKALTLCVPLLYKKIIDSLSLTNEESIIVVPLGILLAYGTMRVMAQLFLEGKDFLFPRTETWAIRQIATRIFSHLLYLDLAFHLDRKTGEMTRSLEKGSEGIANFLYFVVFNIGPTLLEVILACGVIFYLYGFSFGGSMFITLAIYIVFTLKVSEWRSHFARQINQIAGETNAIAVDSLLNYETVKYFNNEVLEINRYETSCAAKGQATIKSRSSLSMLNLGQNTIISMGLVFILYLAAKRVLDGVFSIGDFVTINVYLLQVYQPLNMLGFAYREAKQALINMERLFALLDRKNHVPDKSHAKSLKLKKGEIEFSHVSFHYDAERPILKDLSFTVPAGKTLAIVGESGAGKSTISRLLFRFYDVTEGVIRIDGQDLRDITQESLREHIGIVPQDTVLFNETLLYNIMYGKKDASLKEVEKAIQSAHLDKFIGRLPEGYHTLVGERGLKLSGGEKQRVALARMFLKKPDIYMFDEATSSLDTRTEREIQKSLKVISQHRTTLIIAHRLSTIVDADKIIVLDHGQMAEQGTHKELLEKKGLYEQMWSRQQHEKH